MSPDKRKGEQPVREAAEEELRRRDEAKRQADADADPREEDGWSQPESSAQKSPPEPGE